MEPVKVQGSFVTEDGYRVEGLVAFVPDRLWVMIGSKAMATFAPMVELDNGAFEVELTPTDTGWTRWRYKAITPAGVFKIAVPYQESPHLLKDLIDKSRSKKQ